MGGFACNSGSDSTGQGAGGALGGYRSCPIGFLGVVLGGAGASVCSTRVRWTTGPMARRRHCRREAIFPLALSHSQLDEVSSPAHQDLEAGLVQAERRQLTRQ
jgi:hypothetical protein